jgi:hypothetical protein
MNDLKHALAARRLAVPAVLFIGFVLLYSGFRSGNIFAVDGAHRCLRVWHEQRIFFHGTNHMLYPVDVLVWTRLLSTLGFKVNAPLEFYADVELMNSLAGAACVAILFALLSVAGVSGRIALGASIGYGLSRAFLAHATNAAEPLMGVFWSFLGLGFAVLPFKVKSNWPVVVSGFLFSLAMATYQSSVLLAPAAIVLVWRARTQGESRRAITLPQCLAVLTFALSGLAGCALIYGSAYRRGGLTSLSGMLRRFFSIQGAGVIVGARGAGGKTLNIGVGLVRNLFPVLSNYTGIRTLFAGPKVALAGFLLLLFLVSSLAVFCLGQVWKRWTTLPASLRTAFVAASIGLASTLLALLAYDPSYDKMWLQPLACLAFLAAVALHVICQGAPSKASLSALVASLLLIGIGVPNLVMAARSRRIETAGMPEAQLLSETVEKDDFVVGGWDNVSMFYADIWADDGQFMDFSSEAAWYGRAATMHLHDAVVKTAEKGGRVYFLDLLDESKQAWDGYLGSRCGVPFSDFDYYRAHAHVLRKIPVGGYEISFSQLDPGIEPPSLGTCVPVGGAPLQER